MGRYNEQCSEWKVRLPKSLGFGKRKFGTKIVQVGMVSFGRKPKNGSRLTCKRVIANAVKDSVRRAGGVRTCEQAYPKIKIT